MQIKQNGETQEQEFKCTWKRGGGGYGLHKAAVCVQPSGGWAELVARAHTTDSTHSNHMWAELIETLLQKKKNNMSVCVCLRVKSI